MFPDILEKMEICPVLEKGNKQTINDYRSVSLLPISGKIF